MIFPFLRFHFPQKQRLRKRRRKIAQKNKKDPQLLDIYLKIVRLTSWDLEEVKQPCHDDEVPSPPPLAGKFPNQEEIFILPAFYIHSICMNTNEIRIEVSWSLTRWLIGDRSTVPTWQLGNI